LSSNILTLVVLSTGDAVYGLRKRPVHERQYDPYSPLPSQSAETTWPLHTSPVPQMYGLSALSSSICTPYVLCFSGSSLTCVIACKLYHYNPWMDTATSKCSSFYPYLSNRTNFLMRRFAGMALPLLQYADKLAEKKMIRHCRLWFACDDRHFGNPTGASRPLNASPRWTPMIFAFSCRCYEHQRSGIARKHLGKHAPSHK
jgi:hypothetical protein